MKAQPVRFVFSNKQGCMVPWKPSGSRKRLKKNSRWVTAKKVEYSLLPEDELRPAPVRFNTAEDGHRYLGILKDGIKPTVLTPSAGKAFDDARYELSFIYHNVAIKK